MIEYSTRSWLSVVLRLRGTVVKRVIARTLSTAALAGVVVYANTTHSVDLRIPVVVHSIIGVALGLLLVFRTNASYDRYWEGRRSIGNITGRCRDLARQISVYLSKAPERRDLAGRYVVALYHAMKRQLRGELDQPEIVELLGAERAAALDGSAQAPLVIASWLTELFVAAADDAIMSETRLRNMDTNLTQLIAYWADVERISSTPVPFAYAHHIKVFLTLFCFSVPLALADLPAWYAVGGAAAVSFALFGIDEIGVEIEDPFGHDDNDLPLDAIGNRLEADVIAITGAGAGAGVGANAAGATAA